MNASALLSRLTLVSLLAISFGCAEESPVLESQVEPSLAVTGGPWFEPTPLEVLDQLAYEEFHGVILPGQGGWLTATMTTWPGNSVFNIMVPPGALLDDDPDPVAFSLRVPTYQSYVANASANNGRGLPLIMRLEPSNLNFEVPVRVMGTYMPWTGVTAADVFDYWTVAPFYEHFGSMPSVYLVRNRVRFEYDAPHFSDWEVGGGIPDEIVPE